MTVDELIGQAHELEHERTELAQALDSGEISYVTYDEQWSDLAGEAWELLRSLIDELEKQP